MSTGLLAVALTASAASAADIYVGPGDSLQAAIDRAQPGDRLLLAAGATFVGNFVLPNKGASTAFITIRSAAADSLLPADGVRITPADAFNLPKLRSPNTSPALALAAGAHHWRLQFLEFLANDRGFGDIIKLGDGTTAQSDLSQVPYQLVLDRLYIHGDPVIGQKRGVALHSGATWILNCYISDMKAVGIDSQAIMGYNGPGPWSVVNNYLEGAGENVLIGGASPKIPNLVPSDLEFRRNHLFKPLAWRQPILQTPAGVAATPSSGGTLPGGTYSYRVVAVRRTAQDAWTFSARSSEVLASVSSGGRVVVAWSAVPNAESYRIYRGAVAGAQDRYFTSTSTSFSDDGTIAGTADTGASMTGTVWSVKNLFELKLGQRVLVEGNLMENCWKQAQTGWAVLFTPRNQDNTSPWVYVRDVTFTRNVVRHAGAGMQIEGWDSNATSQQTQRIAVTHNLFDDINSSRWGGNGTFVQIGNQPRDVTIDHNTVLHNGTVIVAYGASYTGEKPVYGFVMTNNLLKHNAYGIKGDGTAIGNGTLAAYFPGSTVSRNTFAGGSASNYPATNEFPSVATWEAQFVDVAAADYTLVDGSPYRGSGTDGGDLGVPYADVMDEAAAALAGRDTGVVAPAPVSIQTATLPTGVVGSSYSVVLAALGGSGVYQWSVASGELPQGLAVGAHTGEISGTPAGGGSFVFTVRAQDGADAANAATAAYTLSVASLPPQVAITSPVSGAVITGASVALAASASDPDGQVVRVEFQANGMVVGSAAASPWTATWSGVAPGAYEVTATATDADGLSATSAPVALTVVAPCSFTVSPGSLSAAAAGTSSNVEVIASADTCSWSAASPVTWISLARNSGSGSATVSLSVAANAGAARTAVLTIAGQPVTVTQQAAPVLACTYTISPTSVTTTATAKVLTVSVATQAGCGWSSTSGTSWLRSSTAGTGSGSASVSVSRNNGRNARTGQVTIAGQVFTVTQQGR